MADQEENKININKQLRYLSPYSKMKPTAILRNTQRSPVLLTFAVKSQKSNRKIDITSLTFLDWDPLLHLTPTEIYSKMTKMTVNKESQISDDWCSSHTYKWHLCQESCTVQNDLVTKTNDRVIKTNDLVTKTEK